MSGPVRIIAGGWLFLLLVMMALWPPPVVTGSLPDTDDYMRMVRVFDLLDGRDYPSYAAPRLGVGGHAEIGWSRLVDWPLAALQGTFELFTDRIDAAMVTATLAPALALLAFIVAAIWYARPLIGNKSAIFVIFAILFLWALLRQFMPGRVDHHMLQIVLGVTAFGALMRIGAEPARLLYPAIAGAAFATGLAIGADIIPWLFFGAVLSGLFWLAAGKSYERPGLVLGAVAFVTALIFYGLLHDPGRLWMPVCDALSVVWLALALALFSFWGIVTVLPAAFKDTGPKRFVAGLVIAAPLLGGLYALFPACFHDPHQIDNPLVRAIWLDAVVEARPLPAFWIYSPAAALFLIVPPALALAGCVWALFRETERRVLWGGLALVLAGGFALMFYQVRTADFLLGVSLAPLAWFLATAFDQSAKFVKRFNWTRRQRLTGASLFFLSCITALALAVATKEEGGQAKKQAASCDVRAAAAQLNTLERPLTIAAYIDAGSEILFRTPHKVLAAPYHRNEEGILAAYNILTAPDAAASRALMAQSGADALMICNDPGNLWTKNSAFAHDLFNGKAPDWLEPVGQGAYGGYLIFRVRPWAREKPSVRRRN